MDMKKKRLWGLRILAAVLALLLTGCGAAAPTQSAAPAETAAPEATAAPAETAAPEIPSESIIQASAAFTTANVIRVSNVDELLAAIAPDTTIVLAAGDYALYAAKNYGGESGSQYYAWTREFDGPALEIRDIDKLVLLGEGSDRVTLTVEPRYANVLRFVSCRDLAVEGLTAGHVRESGACTGGVLRFENCRSCTVRHCGLFGCGTVGVWAADCAELTIEDSAIYECSYNAVSLDSCRNVRVKGGEVYGCGRREGMGGALSLFDLHSCENAAIAGVRVHDNTAQRLLDSFYSRSVVFLSNEVRSNAFSAFFCFEPSGAVVDGCRFEGNSSDSWYPYGSVLAADLLGQTLDGGALAAMTLREIDPDMILPPSASEPQATEAGAELTVTTVDEFLAAIGPDRTIVLDGALFDLSTASGYGSNSGKYWFWQEVYDGYALVVDGVRGLTIKADSQDPMLTTLAAVPRYANVLSFRYCRDITLSGFTAGHTAAPGACGGGVLYFENCGGVTVNACRLYGCGTLGLEAYRCSDLRAVHTEIYECSEGAVNMYDVEGAAFLSCDVHDVPDPALVFHNCSGVSWDGEKLYGEYFVMDGVTPVEAVSIEAVG